MGQPTQKLPSVYKTRARDTPPQPSAATPSRRRLSFSSPDDVQWLMDVARQLVLTTTIFPRAQACPTPPRGLFMFRIRCQRQLEGRPETSIS